MDHKATFLFSDTMIGTDPAVLIVQANEQPRGGAITSDTYRLEAAALARFLRDNFCNVTLSVLKEQL